MTPIPPLLADRTLAQRLERAEGSANAAFIESRARIFPDGGAEWIEVAGARAMYDTPSSPVTQTFGLGMFGPVSPCDMNHIETFFLARGAHVHHEICPLADQSLWPIIADHGYQAFEFTSVMFLDLVNRPRPVAASGEIEVRVAEVSELDLWAATAGKAWSESHELSETLPGLLRIVGESGGVVPFFAFPAGAFPAGAFQAGRPIATGALNIQGDIALLAGGATIPEARNRGAQRALLEARLLYAADTGCEIAMMGAAPGSASQRNAERQGFRIAYTRTKWRLPEKLPDRRTIW